MELIPAHKFDDDTIANKLINESMLNKFDTTGIRLIYDKWDKVALNYFNLGHEYSNIGNVQQIVFAGMGSSGTIGDVFEALYSHAKIRPTVVKGYTLPNTVNSNTLVVATSISGNTDEVLNVIDEAEKHECKIVAFTSGGKLEDYCKRHNIVFEKIDLLHSPRASSIAFLYFMLKTLLPVTPFSKSHIMESIELLRQLQQKINSTNLNSSNEALDIASWISSPPLIFHPPELRAAAIRFKNSLQENSKMHAAVEDVVESSHNAIVAWENPSYMKPLLLERDDEHPKIRERCNILKEYFIQNGIQYKKIHAVSGNTLSRLICSIYLFDYVSIYRAVMSSIDPSPVRSIDFIKERISSCMIPTESTFTV